MPKIKENNPSVYMGITFTQQEMKDLWAETKKFSALIGVDIDRQRFLKKLFNEHLKKNK